MHLEESNVLREIIDMSRPFPVRNLGSAGRTAATALFLVLVPAIVNALPATDFSFADASTLSIEFDEIAMSQSTVITNQYEAGFGVTFSPNVWYENNRGALGWAGTGTTSRTSRPGRAPSTRRSR
jgi:hypothetical protein